MFALQGFSSLRSANIDPSTAQISTHMDPHSQPTEDVFSLDLLITRVEELQRLDQLEIIQELTLDNSLLQQVIVEYQRQWCCTIALLEKIQEAALELQKAVENCSAEYGAAERAWLAAEDFERHGTDLRTCNLGGWV